ARRDPGPVPGAPRARGSRDAARRPAAAARSDERADAGRGGHRVERLAGLPDAHDRQRHVGRTEVGHGRDCRGGRRRTRRRAESRRGEGAAADRSQRGRGRRHRTIARAGRRARWRRRTSPSGVRVGSVGRRRRRSGRDVRHRRDLSEGIHDRQRRYGREERPRVQTHHREARGQLLVARNRPRRADALGHQAGRAGRQGDKRVKTAGIILAIVLALALQTTIARFVVSGTVAVDLVLVVVVYVALSSGSVPGLLTGTVAGLIQDSLSTGVIGIGGLAKTIVGFITGIVGTQLNIAEPVARFVVFFVATVAHQAITIGLGSVLGLRPFGTPYAAIAG